MYTMQCTLCNVHYTLYTEHYILNSIHCTMNIEIVKCAINKYVYLEKSMKNQVL